MSRPALHLSPDTGTLVQVSRSFPPVLLPMRGRGGDTKSGSASPFLDNPLSLCRDVPPERLYDWTGKGGYTSGSGMRG
jgi:hypothetical protein